MLGTGCFILGMSACFGSFKVPSLNFTLILMEGHCNLGIWVGPCYSPYAGVDSLLTVGAFNSGQSCPVEAQEWWRAIRGKTRQTAVN